MQDPVNVFVAFSAGAFSFLSPCVLPLFPSYLAFITGMSIDELSAAKSRSLKPVITNSVMFIAGFSIVFIATGASLGSLGGRLLDYRNIIQVLGGILIIFLACTSRVFSSSLFWAVIFNHKSGASLRAF